MIKRVCDICNKELSFVDDRDSTTQFFTLIKNKGEANERECDICNSCLWKIIKGGNI